MGRKVLVIDDDPVLDKGLEILLTNAGYKTKVSDKGDTALTLASEFKPDIILLDIMLGGLDGREIAESLRKSHPTRTTPIILISANHYMQRDFEKCGAEAFISKPFESRDLLRVLQKYCE